MQIMNKRIIFRANPQYYDYIHHFILDPDEEDGNQGKIGLYDGGGQVVNFVGEGRYTIEILPTSGKLIVDQVVGGSPMRKTKKEYPSFSVNFKIEQDPEYMVYWGATDHLQVKYMKCQQKYIFDKDPLEFCLNHRQGNLMFMLGQEPDLARRTYYGKVEEVTRNTLIENHELFSKTGYYYHDVDLNKLDQERTKELTQRIKTECESIDSNCWKIIKPLIEIAKKDHQKANHRWTSWILTSYYDLVGQLIGFYVLEAQPYQPETNEKRFIILHLMATKDPEIFKQMARDICKPMDDHPEINHELVADDLTPEQMKMFGEAVPDLDIDLDE